MSVLTVDDCVPFHAVARQLVQSAPGFTSAGEVASAQEAFRAVESSPPGLVLMDVQMPDINGIAATRWIRSRYPDVVVVLISAEEPAALPTAVFECGAAAVLRKQDLRPSVLDELWRTQHPR